MLADEIAKLPSLKQTVENHGLMAKKALGQNFLLDNNITDKIIKLSLTALGKKDFSGDNVFEIGPGPGGLTRSILAKEPKKLTVIEMDDRCILIMQEIKEKVLDRIEIVNADALKQDLSTLEEAPRHIISNLPYNISVPLLIKWLRDIKNFDSLTLMFQKEVADRILATPKCKAYGRISILSQLICDVERLFDISPTCFVPAPKIWSTVLVFRPKKVGITKEQFGKIEGLTNLAFGQRRKMLRQSLKTVENMDKILESLNIKNTCRAEELSPEQFLEIVEMV